MQFRTILPIEIPNFWKQNRIDYSSELLLLGSCFAENIGKKFEYFKFKNTINPFGIIFNPISIEKLIERVVSKNYYKEEDIFFYNDLWHCFEVHSELSNPNKEDFLKELNDIIEKTHFQISNLSHLQITYGTSWVYRHLESNETVANCHKVPQKQFVKELLPIEEIQKSIQKSILSVQKINANCQFIFTISPVRHIKDGFVENSVSKAHLISAIYNSQLTKCNSCYFPSFEIIMDELRDYRFYSQDMLHPNQTAIDYIWQRFAENYISKESLRVMVEVESIQKSLLHKSFNPSSDNHKKFLSNLDKKIAQIKLQVPHFQFY